MVGKADEYLVHQTEKPLAQVASEHPDWQDRFYFNIHDRKGEVIAITGIGAFPNRKTMQAYLFAVHEGEHSSYLNVRQLDNDRETMVAGSLAYSIIEPLKRWRLEVGDEAGGVEGSLEFQARCPLYFFNPIRWQNGDRPVVHQMHYTQPGTYSGSLRIGGRTFTDLVGMRDRSWGIRAMAEVPFWIWISAQFGTYSVSAWLWETPEGEVIHADGAVTRESGETEAIVSIKHELQLWPGTKRPKTARFELATNSGDSLSLTASEIQTIFLAPGLGRWRDSESEALAQADRTAFGFDQHCRFQLGRETGYGVVEYILTGGAPRYGIPPVSMASA